MDWYRYRDDATIAKALQHLHEEERLKIDMTLLDELYNYTAYGKTMRDISAASYRTSADMHALTKPYEEVQFFRGRVLRIKTGHLPVQRILKRLWAVCTTALYGHDELVKLSPVARKEAAILAILEPLRERMDECELVIETATEVEKLLANAYYTLKELRGINEVFIEEQRRDRNV